MKRGELKRYKALVAKAPIKRGSSKLKVRGDSTELKKAKAAVRERSGGRCEVKLPGICNGRHEETNHIKPRARGRDDSLSNLAAACTPCHHWITTHPTEATELGHTRSGAQEFGAYMFKPEEDQ